MAGKTKIGQFLKSRDSNQIEAAGVIGITPSMFSLKANGFNQREIDKLAKHYSMDEVEIKNVFF